MVSKVGIVYSRAFSQHACLSPKYQNRFAIVMALIHSYKLTEKLIGICPLDVTSETEIKYLSSFHSKEYLEALRRLDAFYANNPDPVISDEVVESLEEYGLAYDCPGFPGVYGYAVTAVCGTLSAITALMKRKCQIAINWAGGWHHGKRSEAAGFCYLNDIVIGLNYFLDTPSLDHTKQRVLYLDFDLHHGDGVEEAFAYNSCVVTFSVHHASPGFFPGTGTVSSDKDSDCCFTGARGGRYSCFNLPLDEGVDDESWFATVHPILTSLRLSIKPCLVVVQCGADGLTSDPHRIFNLSVGHSCAHVLALKMILSWKLPTLILGGGGYNFVDTSRLWTLLTSVALSSCADETCSISDDIPDHPNLAMYGPDYTLGVSNSLRPNRNSELYLVAQIDRLLCQLEKFCRYNDLTFST